MSFCVVSLSEPEQAAKDKASRNAQVSDNSFFIDDTSFLFKIKKSRRSGNGFNEAAARISAQQKLTA